MRVLPVLALIATIIIWASLPCGDPAWGDRQAWLGRSGPVEVRDGCAGLSALHIEKRAFFRAEPPSRTLRSSPGLAASLLCFSLPPAFSLRRWPTAGCLRLRCWRCGLLSSPFSLLERGTRIGKSLALLRLLRALCSLAAGPRCLGRGMARGGGICSFCAPQPPGPRIRFDFAHQS